MKKAINEAHDAWIFPRIWAAALLGLLAVSHRLWIPNEIPSVPLLGSLASVPNWLDIVLMTGLIVVAAVIVLSRVERPRLWWFVAAMLCGLFALDQHRLQPWAYQTAIYGLVFATLKPAIARQWILPMAASVYIYSSLGKLDYQFVHTVGIEFLETLFGPFGGLADKLEFTTRAQLAHLFPAAELIAGVLLLPKTTRRYAGAGVMILHGCLIGMLGPWGLNHSAGVLLWNVALMVQAWLLFVSPACCSPPDQNAASGKLFQLPSRSNDRRPVAGMIACVAVSLAIAMPIFERTGYWDHWPSWALYSPHNSRVDVQIHQSGLRSLPPALLQFVEADTDGDRWQELALDRWSLARRGVPVYPQARYQLGVCVALAEQAGLSDQIRCRLLGVADRRTGQRTELQLLNLAEMQRALADFWLVPHSDESKD